MADFGVDRYGKPVGYDQQANPYKQKQAAPGTQIDQPGQPMDQINGATAQQPQHQPPQQPQQAPQQPGMWNTSVTDYASAQRGIAAPPTQQPQGPPQQPQSWNTDGYSQSQFTAQAPQNTAAGWDPQKWNDPNHQTPKYVVGRIIAGGDTKDPNFRAQAIQQIQQAYPGTTFDGKDVVNIPGVGPVDIWGGADAGTYSPAWQPIQQGGGGGPQSAPMGQMPPEVLYGTGAAGGQTAGGSYSPAPGLRVSQLPTTPLPTYTAGNITQFAAPDQSNIDQSTQALLQQILANPHSMSAQGVGQLKQQSMEEAMAMQRQGNDAMMQNAASRGVTDSGQVGAGQRRSFDSLISSVLGTNRGIDLQKMQQDRADELGALGAGDSYLNSQMGRATSAYDTGLKGQLAQGAENQFAHTSQADAVRFALEQAMGQNSLNLQQQGVDNDSTQIGNQNRQFNLSNDLANRQFADAMQQWRARLGFDYGNAALNANQTFWS